MPRGCSLKASGYFSAVDTVPNVVLRFAPMPLTAVMITTAMPAAIRPYSIAVAALSHARKFLMSFMGIPFAKRRRLFADRWSMSEDCQRCNGTLQAMINEL